PHRHITGLLTPVLGSHLLTPPCSGCCDNQLNPPNTAESESHLQADDEISKARAEAELKAVRRKAEA
ncbi:hypothetical protein ACQX5E_05245, partial [Corynebacterium diphtheriae]